MSGQVGHFPDAEVVATEAEVRAAYERIAAALQPEIFAHDCVMLGIMLGGLIPMARLSARLSGDYEMDYCQVSRYRGATRGGDLEWLQAPRTALDGKTVLLVDDIYDEGITLEYVVNACRELGVARIISIVLVRKRHTRVVGTTLPDHVGLEVDDRYVFGCGMDYRHRWRHLPAIYALRVES
jgi:hypoxanthine phosphoribosyltransferase